MREAVPFVGVHVTVQLFNLANKHTHIRRITLAKRVDVFEVLAYQLAAVGPNQSAVVRDCQP